MVINGNCSIWIPTHRADLLSADARDGVIGSYDPS